MFREGHYLEVIKASDSCLATAIVTVKEKTVEYKKKKITTNKWLDLQDWASLYSIIRKAIIRNHENNSRGGVDTTERRKSTSHLDVKYKFEATDSLVEKDPLPTIRVSVAPARKSSRSSKTSSIKKNEKGEEKHDEKIVQQSSENDNFLLESNSLEEYVPPELPSATKPNVDFDYIPSRKSMLSRMRSTTDANKYTPTVKVRLSSGEKNDQAELVYIPNSIKSLTKVVHEGYDPCGTTKLSTDLSEAYVPSSKNVKSKIEEYQPDFASKTMKFDDSYVPSSTFPSSAKKGTRKRRHGSQDSKNKKSSSVRSNVSKIAKREL